MTWKPLSQLPAFMSKFPTLLNYKMMGITPLDKSICQRSEFYDHCKVTKNYYLCGQLLGVFLRFFNKTTKLLQLWIIKEISGARFLR